MYVNKKNDSFSFLYTEHIYLFAYFRGIHVNVSIPLICKKYN